jgi:hypothetical protein
MAWEKTHTVRERTLTKQQLWSVWEDVNHWHLWDTDIVSAHLEAPFVEGSTFVLKPKGGPKVRIKLLKVEPHTAFTDVTTFPLAKMYGIHSMRDAGDGLEISHTVRIEGPLSCLWRRLVAEKVAAGLEEQAVKMIQRAREIEGQKTPKG